MTDQENKMIEGLYVEMYEPLYRYANVVLKNALLAEEAVQESFRIACTKPDSLRECDNPRGWLVNTTKMVVRNSLRVRARMERMMVHMDIIWEGSMMARNDRIPTGLLFGTVAETDDFQLVQDVAEGKSVRELARKLGISENACKKRIQRAKSRLRKCLEVL